MKKRLIAEVSFHHFDLKFKNLFEFKNILLLIPLVTTKYLNDPLSRNILNATMKCCFTFTTIQTQCTECLHSAPQEKTKAIANSIDTFRRPTHRWKNDARETETAS